MTNSLKATFASASPLKQLAVGLALTVGAVFTASAHVPPPGSEQHNMLKKHEAFVMQMKNKAGSSCCSLNDGRGDLKEEILQDGRYKVTITHDLAGNKLPTPKEVIIPESAVLSASHAKSVCDAADAGKTKEEKAKSTCKAPLFNVIWYTDSGHVYCYYPRPQVMN